MIRMNIKSIEKVEEAERERRLKIEKANQKNK